MKINVLNLILFAVLIAFVIYAVQLQMNKSANNSVRRVRFDLDDESDDEPENIRVGVVNNRINVRTRGQPPEFTQIGILTLDDNNDDDVVDNENIDAMLVSDRSVLPLWGRPTYRGSQNWNYFTIDSNGVRIPIKNCFRPRGCREFENGQRIHIGTLRADYIVTLYHLNYLRYLPW